MQNLDVITLNIWQILISLCNLLILFLVMKKFLYKPVQKMLAQRQKSIDDRYEEAEKAKQEADEDQRVWSEKLGAAQSQADALIKRATDNADRRSDEIVADAKSRAEAIVRQAHEDAVLERQKAEDEIKKEIADISVILAGKILEREISADDHRALMDSFMDQMGEDDGTDS